MYVQHIKSSQIKSLHALRPFSKKNNKNPILFLFLLFSFITEGAIEYDNERYESNGDMTVWDAFKIGVKGANQMLLGSGLEIMLNALEKAKTDGVSVPPFVEALDMKVLRNLIKTAKTVHDQKLDRWGPRTASHSGRFFSFKNFSAPF